MKLIKRFFMLALFLCLVLPVLWETEVQAVGSGDLTYVISDGEVTIISCDQDATDPVIIPEKIGGYPVTTIAANAFKNCDNIHHLTIPATVTYVGNNAFAQMNELDTITFRGNAPYIAYAAQYWSVNAAFYETEVFLYYPEGDSTWASIKNRDLAGYYMGEVIKRTYKKGAPGGFIDVSYRPTM